MAKKLAELRAMSGEEVEAAYDATAQPTVASVNYGLNDWRDELNRRTAERAGRSAERLARATVVLSIVSTAIALAALFVTIAKP